MTFDEWAIASAVGGRMTDGWVAHRFSGGGRMNLASVVGDSTGPCRFAFEVSRIMNRNEAWDLLSEYTKTPALVRHGQCVEASMRYYARKLGADEEQWGVVGLLHDFD